MPRDPTVLLDDMMHELVFLADATEGRDLDDLHEDAVLRKAIERSLEIVGEAAKAVPTEIKERHPEIAWSEMARMRDMLIHAYHRTDVRIVWKTVVEDALPLVPILERVLFDERRRRRPSAQDEGA